MNLNTIYILKNKCNNKIYIGQTWRTIKDRWKSGKGYRGCWHLNRAIERYGKDNFYYEILTFCSTQESADYLEDFFIKKYNSTDPNFGFNIKNGGSNGKHSAITNKKISKAKKGIPGHKQTEKTRSKISKNLIGNKHAEGHSNKNALGSKRSDEIRKIMSISLKGKFSPKGENCDRSKITEKIVLEIRNDFEIGKYTKAELSRKYHLHKGTIRAIVRRETWRHI